MLRKHWTSFILLLIIVLLPLGTNANIIPFDEDAAESEYVLFNGNGDISFPAGGITTLQSISDFNGDGNLIIAIDPGHGIGHNFRADSATDEGTMNYKVAIALKNYLENNCNNVTVFLTRDDTVTGAGPSLQERGQIAAEGGADLFISCHFNASAEGVANGGEVFVSVLEEYKLNTLAENILNNLTALGIKDRGVRTRASNTNTLWADGIRTADYYGVIKHSITHEIPAIIIEHCFYDSSDYANFANTDAKLKTLGESNAKAIIKAFNLNENISDSELETIRSEALNKLDSYWNSIDLKIFSNAFADRAKELYDNSRNRIETATCSGKINLTINRVLNTLKNYPVGTGSVFKDIKKTDWFYTAVMYCYENKFFYGATDITFEPYTNITRGMFVTVLGRMAGANNIIPADSGFSDVKADKYYAPYVKWAKENNIVTGVGNNRFNPDTAITRQELAKIYMGFCNYTGKNFSSNGKNIYAFPDAGKVDAWAVEAMNWAIAAGIINGSDGELQPKEPATRAQVAQIIYNGNN